MSIVRIQHNKDNPYVVLNKKALEDKKVSWAAKGLWSYLMSRPDDWQISVSHLSKIYDGKGGGERAMHSLLGELIEHGYCSKEQKFNAKGQFERLEYTITEFKNKVPHRSQADAVEAGALESPPTKYRYILSTKEQQQEPVGSVAAFYSCIPKELSEKEKKCLMKHPEEEVKRAVAFAMHSNTKIQTTLIKTIIWALKEKPDIPGDVDQEANKKYAQNAEKVLESKAWNLDAMSAMVIIYSKTPNNTKQFELQYDEINFKYKFDNLLKENGFKMRKK